jgi:hypothetical protein
MRSTYLLLPYQFQVCPGGGGRKGEQQQSKRWVGQDGGIVKDDLVGVRANHRTTSSPLGLRISTVMAASSGAGVASLVRV